jgi:hypothetical protein
MRLPKNYPTVFQTHSGKMMYQKYILINNCQIIVIVVHYCCVCVCVCVCVIVRVHI